VSNESALRQALALALEDLAQATSFATKKARDRNAQTLATGVAALTAQAAAEPPPYDETAKPIWDELSEIGRSMPAAQAAPSEPVAYPPLPVPWEEAAGFMDAEGEGCVDLFTADQMRAYVDADRARQASPPVAITAKVCTQREKCSPDAKSDTVSSGITSLTTKCRLCGTIIRHDWD
jgi:hypothetical protein